MALDGIRVVDFTTAGAGPCATMMLADFGADVIKIEPPHGDSSRRWGATPLGGGNEFSGLFLSLNRNKSSVVLDLKTDHGRTAVQRIMATADVVVENFKPGVADRIGVGYDDARRLRPDVVYCSLSGFGQTGPMREQPGFDNLVQACTGHMSVTGEPGRPSVRIGISANDILTGAHGAYGVLVALLHRMKTGEGQHIDTSLYDTGIHLMSYYIADFTGSGNMPGKSGPFFPFLSPYGVFQAADREFYLGAGTDKLFRQFCAAIERDDLVVNPLYTTNNLRVRNNSSLSDELAPIFVRKTGKEWVDMLVAHAVPASLVSDVREVIDDQEQARARHMLVETGVDGVLAAGPPIKMSGTPAQIRRDPPRLGADTERILSEVGLSGADAVQS